MSDEQFEDFKDYLDFKLVPLENGLKELRNYTKKRFDANEALLRDQIGGVADAITGMNSQIDRKFENHERRLKKLELTK